MEIPASLTNQVAHLYYELEALVDANKLRAYTNRLRISENSMVALELASAAFNENRQLLNDASTAIVRSKKVMIQKLASDQGMSNEEIRDLVDAAELNYLDRRSSLNKAVLDINNRMSRINSELIELIEEILQRNSDLLSSNEENLRIFNEMTMDFRSYLENEGSLSDLSETNQSEHTKVFQRASDNTNLLEQVFSAADVNRQSLVRLRDVVDQQRTRISQQWTQIEAQQELCFDTMNEKQD